MKMHRMLAVGALALAAVATPTATPTAAQAADQPPAPQSDQLPVVGIWPQLDELPVVVAPGVVTVAKLLGVPVVNPPAKS
ncbi:hypothetical protein [Streptomyces sp. NBC_00005]|uniref:hypothetical protein n=1 Tax=Streptomyces sp. NBC_00005 TaxID=2903609 RepID=UPI003249CABA